MTESIAVWHVVYTNARGTDGKGFRYPYRPDLEAHVVESVCDILRGLSSSNTLCPRVGYLYFPIVGQWRSKYGVLVQHIPSFGWDDADRPALLRHAVLFQQDTTVIGNVQHAVLQVARETAEESGDGPDLLSRYVAIVQQTERATVTDVGERSWDSQMSKLAEDRVRLFAKRAWLVSEKNRSQPLHGVTVDDLMWLQELLPPILRHALAWSSDVSGLQRIHLELSSESPSFHSEPANDELPVAVSRFGDWLVDQLRAGGQTLRSIRDDWEIRDWQELFEVTRLSASPTSVTRGGAPIPQPSGQADAPVHSLRDKPSRQTKVTDRDVPVDDLNRQMEAIEESLRDYIDERFAEPTRGTPGERNAGVSTGEKRGLSGWLYRSRPEIYFLITLALIIGLFFVEKCTDRLPPLWRWTAVHPDSGSPPPQKLGDTNQPRLSEEGP